MKTSTFHFWLLITQIAYVFAQGGSLTFFSQNGERFYVILDGIRQNSTAATNVKITDLTRPNYKAKIIFEDPSIPSIDKTVFVQDIETKTYLDMVYNIRRNKNGVMDIRISSISEISNTPAASHQNVVKYHTEETKQEIPITTSASNKSQQVTSTHTTTITGPTGMNTSATIQETGENVTINIGMGVPAIGTNITTTTSTTITHQTTTPPSGISVTNQAGESRTDRCLKPISNTEFAAGKNTIKNQSFADSQLKVAKTFTKNNCLSVDQIREIMDLFSFESHKLDYAKFAYDYCFDKNNYYQLSSAFKFSSSADELNEFLESK